MSSGLVIGIFWTLLWSILVAGDFHLQNVICESLDTTITNFSRCEMKFIRRGVTAFYMVWKVFKVPINKVDINVSLHKKSNGYRPFLFNQTLDFCYYMRNPQAHPLIYMMHKVFIQASNINHTCPYNHDVIINEFMYKENDLKDLPIPNGEYMIRLKVAFDKEYRTSIKIYAKRKD
ncbi:uncharacterized protein LOC6532541 [Drosophila yakuba]|uniref:MD-2-related lipid-recognition domain-containing protein n=1 Tax=Drosophila yakuba TaxID=7245 RepID=B4PEU4_DROYA|nr:uncharacterized protein LOC6532541 [Drosophila yakuba]EDW92999.2 uncharacterized protein Dyak_GE21225 [Drosophila yakuba]